MFELFPPVFFAVIWYLLWRRFRQMDAASAWQRQHAERMRQPARPGGFRIPRETVEVIVTARVVEPQGASQPAPAPEPPPAPPQAALQAASQASVAPMERPASPPASPRPAPATPGRVRRLDL